MSLSDPISDMLTRIRNAGKAKLPETSMPSSKMKASVADVLKGCGYIQDWRVEGDTKKTLTLTLKYKGKHEDFVIEGLKRISKPSRRVYVGGGNIPRVLGGLGVAVMSTSQGIMSGQDAKKQNIGGEVLCHVW